MIDKKLWEELNKISEQELLNESDEEELDDLDFDSDDIDTPTKEEIAFANEIKSVLQELIDNEDLTLDESFKSRSRLVDHFNNHCLGLYADRQSRRSNVFYDFEYVNQYKEREEDLSEAIKRLKLSDNKIAPTLVNIEEVNKAFRKFFEGNRFLAFPAYEGFRRNGEEINLFLHSYSTDVTTNYRAGNTIDLIITTAGLNNTTLTMYSVDANYLENKLNNIIRKYNIYNIEPLKINH